MKRRASIDEVDVHQLDPTRLGGLSKEQLLEVGNKLLPMLAQDRKEMQLYYYKPASEYALKVHQSTAKRILVGGGNRSGKTQTGIVEMLARATGIVPLSLREAGIDWKKRLRGPINCRMVVADVANVMHEVILPMFRYNEWRGVDEQGGQRGHWGWAPKDCLIEGNWQKSYSEKYRTLRLHYRNPEDPEEILGESTIQFMSHKMQADSFASADLHFVLLDEPPPLHVYRECQARVMGVGGSMWIVMTWPKDPAINVDWIFDELYDRAIAGPNKDPDIDYFELPTVANENLDTAAIEEEMGRMDDRTRAVMMLGKPIRFSNRVHELFTDAPDWWCFACGVTTWVVGSKCQKCNGDDVVEFCHVQGFEHQRSHPVIWVVDPHPRKPHMSAYFAVLPDDSVRMVAEVETSGTPTDLRLCCERVETELGLVVKQQLIDPRMAAQPGRADIRESTWLDEFHAAGLNVDPADNSDVGRELFDLMLRPDPGTRKPHFVVHPRCQNAILQFKRFMWDDWKMGSDKDVKQKVKQKYDDYPAMVRYLCNSRPSHKHLLHGYQPVRAINLRQPQGRRTAAPTFSARW